MRLLIHHENGIRKIVLTLKIGPIFCMVSEFLKDRFGKIKPELKKRPNINALIGNYTIIRAKYFPAKTGRGRGHY